MKIIFYDLKIIHDGASMGLTYTNISDFIDALTQAFKIGDQIIDINRREVRI